MARIAYALMETTFEYDDNFYNKNGQDVTRVYLNRESAERAMDERNLLSVRQADGDTLYAYFGPTMEEGEDGLVPLLQELMNPAFGVHLETGFTLKDWGVREIKGGRVEWEDRDTFFRNFAHWVEAAPDEMALRAIKTLGMEEYSVQAVELED